MDVLATVRERVDACDWEAIAVRMDRDGGAVTDSPLLTADECAALREGFDDERLFRSTVHMARHDFGEGTYRYYANPLPRVVGELRDVAYTRLAPIATEWERRLATGSGYPAALDEFLRLCHAAGQTRPTPLVLRYVEGGWNALHQDLYGDVVFPLQLTVALTRPGVDFTGGANLLVEQRPRVQSRGTAFDVPLGHALVFPTRHRPVAGRSGDHRTVMRHGVSTVTSGTRFTLGVIFHDAA